MQYLVRLDYQYISRVSQFVSSTQWVYITQQTDAGVVSKGVYHHVVHRLIEFNTHPYCSIVPDRYYSGPSVKLVRFPGKLDYLGNHLLVVRRFVSNELLGGLSQNLR